MQHFVLVFDGYDWYHSCGVTYGFGRARYSHNVTDLETLQEVDIDTICQLIRRPGGTVESQPAVAAAGEGAQPAPVVAANTGVSVGHITVTRLKKLLHYVQYNVKSPT